MTTLQSYDTPQLLHILNSRSGGMELVGTEFKNIDELVDATHKELDRRFAERGEFVRLSNKQKTMCGPWQDSSRRGFSAGFLATADSDSTPEISASF